ncbi:MAG: zinc ribbon domain-containing protein [Lachnospiraceae bacterium]|nr:zinc ribbon domain-containing protein [Lachnospiraceae bacterium]
MNCPKCGAILADDARFCTTCGEQLVTDVVNNLATEITEVNEPAKPTVSKPDLNAALSKANDFAKNDKPLVSLNPRILQLIGLVVGTVFIIIGFTRIGAAGTSISSTSFGGDFYTYTYRGIVAISEQLEALGATLGWILVAIGAAIDIRALRG